MKSQTISVNHILVCLGVRDFMLGAEGLSNVRICIFSSVSWEIWALGVTRKCPFQTYLTYLYWVYLLCSHSFKATGSNL